MREKYLEVAKYPTAELSVARSTLKFPEEGKEVKGEAKGNLTVHGQTRGVHFAYRASKGQSGFDVTGSMRINIHDFGIDIPPYMGVTVKPNVDIAVHFVAQDN